MGIVLEVENVLINKNFALKVIDMEIASPDAVRRFQRESKVLSELDHTHIIKALDFGILDETTPYVLMELIDGQTLAEYLRQHGKLSIDKFNEIFLQIISALEFAHSKGIVHRDIKPGNIMLLSNGGGHFNAKLLDFGIASWTERAAEAFTKTGEMIGTPLYMSPEQVSGQPITSRSDLYSLGCVMFEALTGVPPFIGRSVMETLLMHREASPPSLTEASLGGMYPANLENVLKKMLAKAPAERFESAQAVADALISQQKIAGKGDGNKTLAKQSSAASNGRFVVLAVSLVLLLGGGIVYCNYFQESARQTSPVIQPNRATEDLTTKEAVDPSSTMEALTSLHSGADDDLSKSSTDPIEIKHIGSKIELTFEATDSRTGMLKWFDGTAHNEKTTGTLQIPAHVNFWLEPNLVNDAAADQIERFNQTPLYGLIIHEPKGVQILMNTESMTKWIKLMPETIKGIIFDEVPIRKADAKALLHLNQIEWFGLKDASVTPDTVSLLVATVVTKNLRTLVLNPRVHNEDPSTIAKPFLSKLAITKNKLKQLCISHCALDAVDCENIARLNDLTYLNVMNSLAQVPRPRAVAILSKMPNLKILAINGEDISQANVDKVIAMKSLKKLIVANRLKPGVQEKLSNTSIQIIKGLGPDSGFQPWKSANAESLESTDAR